MRRLIYIFAILALLGAPALLRAQSQNDDIPLGDLARELRGSRPPEQTEVIDNDNLDRVMDKAESERLDSQPVFSITHAGTFVAVSPDGSCSLTFDARSVNQSSAAYIATDLPQDELPKLEGVAAIEDGVLEVSVHNRTPWELKEIVVGVTEPQAQTAPAEYRFATLESSRLSSPEKSADAMVLYHLTGIGVPDSTTVFRAPVDNMSEVLAQGKDWHWSVVGARGIPPAAQTAIAQSTQVHTQSATQQGTAMPASDTLGTNTLVVPPAANATPDPANSNNR